MQLIEIYDNLGRWLYLLLTMRGMKRIHYTATYILVTYFNLTWSNNKIATRSHWFFRTHFSHLELLPVGSFSVSEMNGTQRKYRVFSNWIRQMCHRIRVSWFQSFQLHENGNLRWARIEPYTISLKSTHNVTKVKFAIK